MANYLRIFLLLIFITTKAFAGDYHQDDAQHVVLYNVTDSSGNHVTGETIRLTMYQVRNNTFFDFSDNTFKALGSVTTLHRTMNENATGGFSVDFATGWTEGMGMTYIMQALILLGAIVITVYATRRGTDLLWKILGAASWIFWFLFSHESSPFGITEGSGAHTFLTTLFPLIGVALCILGGLTRKQTRTVMDKESGNGMETENYGFHLPDWIKNINSNSPEDSQRQETKRRSKRLEEYEDRMDRALRTGKYNGRSRR